MPTDEAQTVSTYASGPMVDSIEHWMRRTGLKRSAAIRDLLQRGLESVELWPPKEIKAA